MQPPVSFSDVVHILGSVHKTLDVRAAAVKNKGRWANYVTVIRLSPDPPKEVDGRLREHENSCGAVTTPNVRIILVARPFSWLYRLVQQCGEGRIRLGDRTVHLPDRPYLPDAKSYLQHGGSELTDSQTWPFYRFSYGQDSLNPACAEKGTRELWKLNYGSLYDAVAELLQINLQGGRPLGWSISVWAPVPISIRKMEIAPARNELLVSILHNPNISELTAVAHFRDPQTLGGRPKRTLRAPFETVSEPKQRTQAGLAKFTVPPDVKSCTLDVEVLHSQIGRVAEDSRSIRSLMPKSERNPLFEALSRFCPPETLLQLVTRPDACEQPESRLQQKSRLQDNFEQHVSWVLSSLGCSVIVLGAHEKLFSPMKTEQGSVDILAFNPSQNTLMPVGCTVRTPIEKDYTNLLDVIGVLKRDVFNESTQNLVPVVVTAATEAPTEWKIGDEVITVINGVELQSIIDDLAQGGKVDLFERVIRRRSDSLLHSLMLPTR